MPLLKLPIIKGRNIGHQISDPRQNKAIRRFLNNAQISYDSVGNPSNITIKTLYHYHKIGLLCPAEVTDAGYRLYGVKELERLQHILFYRELEFPLKAIKQILDGKADRLTILSEQKRLFTARLDRIKQLISTIDLSIQQAGKGEAMDQSSMFKGFSSSREWEDALAEQNRYLNRCGNRKRNRSLLWY